MFLRLLFATFFILVFASCDFISPKNTSLQNLVLLDTIIDYNTVDVYPLLTDCNNCDTNEKQNQCFENELINKLKSSLKENKLKADNYLMDTVYVDILINNLGEISVSKIHDNQDIIHEIPKFDSILRQSIHNLPKAIQPSLKRGIPVNTLFKLPIVVSLKE